MARRRPLSRSTKSWRDGGLLGKTFRDRQSEPILTIGRDRWTRQQIVDQLHCGNFVAAHNLTKIARRLHVDSLDDLVAHCSVEQLFQERDCGITTVYVFLCAQESRQKDPLAWVDRTPDEVVTLATEQRRARVKQREERRAARGKGRRASKAGEEQMNGPA